MSIDEEYQKLWSQEKKRTRLTRWVMGLSVGSILAFWYLGPYLLSLYFVETAKPVIKDMLEAETESVANMRDYHFRDIYEFEKFKNIIQKEGISYKVDPFQRETYAIKFVDTYENIKRVSKILEENDIQPDSFRDYKQINKVFNNASTGGK